MRRYNLIRSIETAKHKDREHEHDQMHERHEKKRYRNSIPLNQQRIVLSTGQMKLEIKCSIPNCRSRAPDSICKLNYHQQFFAVYFHWFFCIFASAFQLENGSLKCVYILHFLFRTNAKFQRNRMDFFFSSLHWSMWKMSSDRETSVCHNIRAFDIQISIEITGCCFCSAQLVWCNLKLWKKQKLRRGKATKCKAD